MGPTASRPEPEPRPPALPLGRVSKVEALVERVSRLIYAGTLAPGTPVRDQELVERFDAGRQTVRSAMQQLARDGLVEHKPHRGWFVRELTLADAEDVVLVLRALECEAVRAVAPQERSREAADAALAALGRLTEADPLDAHIVATLRVHRAIVAGARSASMEQAFDAAARELRLAIAQAVLPCVDTAALYAEHAALVAALWERAPEQAEEAVRAQSVRTLTRLRAAFA
ncbi:MAG: GntR family transcriptional regulator [Conexibacter sp.]